MLLQIKKGSNAQHTLCYIREDGTRTWSRISDYFVLHDLMHFVVERTLGYREAFLGLVASGRNLEDFDRGAKEWLPLQAHWAEVITGALQSQMAGATSANEFVDAIDSACAGLRIEPPPGLSVGLASQMLEAHAELRRQWQGVPPGGTLELQWSSDSK